MPKLEGPPATYMDKIKITKSGITKLLSELNANKAPGPDELPNLPLNNAAKEISPFCVWGDSPRHLIILV